MAGHTPCSAGKFLQDVSRTTLQMFALNSRSLLMYRMLSMLNNVHFCCLLLFLLPQLLWAEGGIKRFYKGFTPCLIRAAPANGAMLYTVDKVTHMLNKE
jgi:hypothetical protein